MLADYNCTCPAGFTGKSCQFNIDDCIDAECSSHSICLDGIDSYTCVCDIGYTGYYCDIKIDHCDPPPCKNGATCNNFPSGFTCHCAPGYTGKLCNVEIDNCKPDSCQNNGTCIDLVSMWLSHDAYWDLHDHVYCSVADIRMFLPSKVDWFSVRRTSISLWKQSLSNRPDLCGWEWVILLWDMQ